MVCSFAGFAGFVSFWFNERQKTAFYA